MAKSHQILKNSDFVHLHNHSQYSLLDGLTKVPALIDTVAKLGMEAIAITDHGTLSGSIDFYTEARTKKIKPIIGIETYVASRKLNNKDVSKDKLNYHLILLAKNQTGYRNLMRLSTIANLEGFYYRPRVDHQSLEKYNEGLICLSACIGGEVSDLLRQNQYQKAKDRAAWYKSVFKDRYYIEIADHGHPNHPSVWAEQTEINEQLIKIANELNLPCVVTCDSHYLKSEDQQAHEILLCIQTNAYLSDKSRFSMADLELHLTDPKDVIDRWSTDHPDFILNTKKIADLCNVQIELGRILIPKFPVPKGETEKSHLHNLVYKGLAHRYAKQSEAKAAKLKIADSKKLLPKEIINRAEYELKIIDQMGFNGYFLIIADFINWGKSQGIVFGPGRGSAAGSIIAYSLNIAEVDPLQYDLLFERFLNPDRISMPDIDIDIQDNRRDEVIKYCIDKYGTDRVANIVTFGRMAARNAVRDVARVLQVPYIEADRLAKMIPPPVQGRHIPLAKSLSENADLKREYEVNDTAKEVFDLAIQLEGTIRSHGVHAAGVVIAPDDIVNYAPLEMAQKGVVATQYSMGPIDSLGLLKIDFLGLSNLTIIKNALRIVKKVYKEDIDISSLLLDDKHTYELLAKGDTTGIFQLESSGMKRYLKELHPTEFEDIVAMVALYRPGPLSAGLTDSFIRRKNGTEEVTFDHPLMKSALAGTYGVLIYQEEFMQISRDVCGFSGSEADTLRKAIGKKNREIMAKMERRFVDGAIANGVERRLIERFWKQLLGFADYCFNKSHAACYALIAYQTAYLKAHYPNAFMAALMTSDFDNTDRLAIEISECQHMGIDVLPPDINESFGEFAVVPGPKQQIRFGMNAIKNVGTHAVDEILTARQSGPFISLVDFLNRVSNRVINRKVLESLIKAGTFDRFNDRSTLLTNLDLITAYSAKMQRQSSSGQTDLFGSTNSGTISADLSLTKPQVVYSSREQLLWERELLGLYLSQHPLAAYSRFLEEQTMPISQLKPEHDNRSVVVGGAINDIREITTKNGQKMAFVKLEDQSAEIELVIFPTSMQQTTGLWKRDRVVLVRGKASNRNRDGSEGNEVKVIVEDAREITDEQANGYQSVGKKKKIPKERKITTTVNNKVKTDKDDSSKERLYIRLISSEDQSRLQSLKSTLDNFKGDTEVVLVLGHDDNKQIIKLPSRVSNSHAMIQELATAVGAENLKFQ